MKKLDLDELKFYQCTNCKTVQANNNKDKISDIVPGFCYNCAHPLFN